PLGVFHANAKNPFVTVRRTHPITLYYPYEDYENVKIDLPEGMTVESLPPAAKSDQKAAHYEFSAAVEGHALRLNRTMRFSSSLFTLDAYPAIRFFYGRVMTGDAMQLITVPRGEDAKQ